MDPCSPHGSRCWKSAPGWKGFQRHRLEANRLADMLAKAVAKQNAVPQHVEEHVKSACVAAHHACALLGVVAHAANSKEVTKFRKDGISFTTKIRDSATVPQPKTPRAEKPVVQEEQAAELALPSDDWAENWACSEAVKALASRRPAVKVRKAALKRKAAKANTERSSLATSRCVLSITASANVDLSKPSANARMGNILARIRSKGGAASSAGLRELRGLSSEAFER